MSQKINNRKRFSSENHQVSNEPSTGIYLIYYFITHLSTEVKPYLCNNFYCTVKSNVLPNMQLPKSQNLTSNSLCDTSSIIINKYASPFNIESQPSNPHTQPSNFVLQNNRRKKFGDTSTMPVNLIKRFANRTSASNSFVQSDGENRKHQTNENVVPGPSTNSNCVFGPSTNSNFCFVLLQNQMLHLVVVLQQ